MTAFLIHIVVTGLIFGIMSLGLKFFLKLKGALDFSYMAIVIFSAYVAALANISWGWGILASTGFAILVSFVFTGLVLKLSSKLSDVYFFVGSFSLYVLCFQLAYNLESLTGGALGLGGIQRNLVGSLQLGSNEGFGLLIIIICALLLLGLWGFKRSYFYMVLRGWGERALIIKSLGVRVSFYTFILIAVTTILAAIGGSLYSFYYLYIDPPSFWYYLLVLLLIISFVSYGVNDSYTLLIAIAVVLFYEFLRFFKVVDPSLIGYSRDIVLSVMMIAVILMVFKKIEFGRQT